MTNLDSILNSRDVTLLTKVCIICDIWTIKKAECQRIDAFELWCWRRLLRVPWTAGRSNQSLLKEINPEYSLEGLMLKLKLQYWGHLMQRGGKDCHAREDQGQKKKGMEKDEMVRQHHQLNRHEFEQTLEDNGGQRSLVCCNLQDCKELGTNWRLNSKKFTFSLVESRVNKASFIYLKIRIYIPQEYTAGYQRICESTLIYPVSFWKATFP